MFGSLENKGKRREKREKHNPNSTTRLYLQNENCAKKRSSSYKIEGSYIGHQMYENTTKPNNLAKIMDKGVIHQNCSRLALITKV